MDIIKRFSGQPVSSNDQIIRTLSIDLGTTNSTVAESIQVPGYPPMCRLIKIEQPMKTGSYRSFLVPSVVAVTGGETILVGEGAKRLRNGRQKEKFINEKNYFCATKNEIGLQRTYAGAPDYLDHAYKVAGYILGFIMEAAEKDAVAPCQSISVTVPASFQLNQRRDTLRACGLADLHLAQDNLLEEPTAALLDYLTSRGELELATRAKDIICLIFDFGGGTCDTAVVAISGNGENRPISLSELSISRYHRLGGGDIDAAIVHQVLLPALLAENNLNPLDLTWAEKKKELEPLLTGTAEILKIELCQTIKAMQDEDQYQQADKETIAATAPPVTYRLSKRELGLSCPSLSAEQFETVLEPYLDTDFLYPRDTEFLLTQSVFSPIEDALDRAGIGPENVDLCLLTGGSSLIPQVVASLETYFGANKVGFYDNPEEMQTAVARGAAWNTIFKTITGRPIVQPVLHDGIDLETNDGTRCQLIAPREPLPWPKDESYKRVKLEVPKTDQLFVDELRIKIMGQLDERHIFNEVWELPQAALQGDEIILEYRVTAGKQFECRAFLAEASETMFSRTIENPLANVVNPGSARLKIEEIEEKLRQKNGGTKHDRDDFIKLSECYRDLNQSEKAFHYLHTALKKIDRPDGEILNLQGIHYMDLKDYDRAEKAFKEASRHDEYFSAPTFNLALVYKDIKQYDKALAVLADSLEKRIDRGPRLALKAEILNRMEEKEQAEKTARQALDEFDPIGQLDDWELGWFINAASLLKDQQRLEKAKAEKIRRKKRACPETDDDTPKPVIKKDIVLSAGQ